MLSFEQMKRLAEYANDKSGELTLDEAKEFLNLETPIGDEADSSLGEFISDESMPEQFHNAEQNMMREEVNEILSGLTDREQHILRLRFGFVDGRIWTLEEVGKEYHVTRERIRQIEARALRHLRNNRGAKRLKVYIE